MRLLEIIIPIEDKDRIDEIFSGELAIEKFYDSIDEHKLLLRVLVENESVNELLKLIEERSSKYRIIILPVEATLPRKEEVVREEEEKIKLGKFITISKAELYEDIEKPVGLSFNFISMVLLSAIVAGIGLLKNNEAIIIGAMVIAPFLGPNISLSFGTVLGDLTIIRKSLLTGIVATVLALLISIIWGYISSDTPSMNHDIRIEYRDILLALVCGFAGVLSILNGQGSALVGVMVAAALLPPLMRAGLFLGGGFYHASLHSFMIFIANIISLNLAGIITFYVSGVRPDKWWDEENAKRKTRRAVLGWVIALVITIIAIALLRIFFPEVAKVQ